ncbi:hypothetical protein GCM10009118_04030 [Wandonia haliotis]|uniref:2TM domain-containing protein n=1 Tax=Wandonia haliotis TaxID=574963 RepID=A0ABP3XX43_9FLAO
MGRAKKNWEENVLIIALVIIVIILIYLVTVGKVNLTSKIDNEKDESIDLARHRHAKLKAHLDKQESLKTKLQKLFKRIYFVIRVLIIAGWSVGVFTLIKFNLIKDIGDFLDYSQLLLIALLVIHFLTFGTISNLKSFLDNIKGRLENRIWGKYINIDEKIKSNKKEINSLEQQILKSENGPRN